MTEDDDITSNYHRGDAFSSAAHASTPAEAKRQDRLRIMQWVRSVGGATCEEMEQALGLSHQTCSARVSELRRDEWLVDTGDKRRTRSNRWARVHAVSGADNVDGQLALATPT